MQLAGIQIQELVFFVPVSSPVLVSTFSLLFTARSKHKTFKQTLIYFNTHTQKLQKLNQNKISLFLSFVTVFVYLLFKRYFVA